MKGHRLASITSIAPRWTGENMAPFFGEVIAQRRHDLKHRWSGSVSRPAKFTQAWVASAVGVCASTIAAWEKGRRLRMIRPAHFWALGEVLRLSPTEMLEAAGYLPSARFAGRASRRRGRRVS